MSALRVGIMLPSRETAMTGRHDARGLVDFAKAAEEAGFDSVWVGDSLLARTRAEPAVGPFRGGRRDGPCRAGDGCVDRAAAPSTARGGASGYGRPALRWPADSRARIRGTGAGEPTRIRRGGNAVRGSWRAARQDCDAV